MRSLAVLLLAAALGASSALLVACGDRSGLLPQGDASNLKSDLDSVDSAVAEHRCSAALDAANRVDQRIQQLPAGVNPRLRRNLEEGLARVSANAQRDCARTTTTTPKTTTTHPTTTQTTTTETTTTAPTTQTTSTTNTQPPTETGPSGGLNAPGQGGGGKSGKGTKDGQGNP